MTDSYFTLRGNAHLGVEPPENPEAGWLWVDAATMRMFVYDPNNLNDPNQPAWVGITSSQNTGSIVYVGERQPNLSDIYENIDQIYPDVNDQVLDPLPGTLWFDTGNQVLKIWYVDGDKNGSWIGITTSHFLNEAVNARVTVLTDNVTDLEAKLDALKEQLDNIQGP
jgi:hypothetical protein